MLPSRFPFLVKQPENVRFFAQIAHIIYYYSATLYFLQFIPRDRHIFSQKSNILLIKKELILRKIP